MRELSVAPEPVLAVVERLSAYSGAWSLSGGWAVDSWLSRQTREHEDVDIAMFHDELETIWTELRDWRLVAHDPPESDHDIPWTGEPFGFPAHLHVGHASDPKSEIQLNERSGNAWILHRNPQVTLPLERFAVRSPWGIAVMAPEAVLFYKGADEKRRARDEQDFESLAPCLATEQRQWLQDALICLDERHPWLTRLG
jgi:hypothetical protein